MHGCVKGLAAYWAWLELMGRLYREGQKVAPRGIPIKEIRNVTMEFPMEENIIVHPVRNLNYKFMVAEWLWIAFGHSELKVISQYNSEMERFSDDGETLYGAYGPRWNNQYLDVLHLLRKDRDTRQAIIQIWKERPTASKDIPCTLTFQFFIRNNQLEMTVNMRSSDVWLGIPYDVFSFTQLGNIIAAELKVKRGQFVMNLGSSHLYQRDEAKVVELITVYDEGRGYRSPALKMYPNPWLDKVLVDPNSRHLGSSSTQLNELEPFYETILQSPRKHAEDRLVELARFP